MKDIYDLNTAAYDAVRENIEAGCTELAVYQVISEAFKRTAGQKVDFLCDIVSGERSTGVEGMPTDRVLVNGDTLIIDILPKYRGLYTDTTRTFFIGQPSEKQKMAYQTLLESLSCGEKQLKHGVSANDIYTKVKKQLDKKGYGIFFPHHAGHRVGEESFMMPDFLPGKFGTVGAGMIVTLEPGIYIPGQFGIRIENNYIIKKTKCTSLFKYPLEIEYFVLKG